MTTFKELLNALQQKDWVEAIRGMPLRDGCIPKNASRFTLQVRAASACMYSSRNMSSKALTLFQDVPPELRCNGVQYWYVHALLSNGQYERVMPEDVLPMGATLPFNAIFDGRWRDMDVVEQLTMLQRLGICGEALNTPLIDPNETYADTAMSLGTKFLARAATEPCSDKASRLFLHILGDAKVRFSNKQQRQVIQAWQRVLSIDVDHYYDIVAHRIGVALNKLRGAACLWSHVDLDDEDRDVITKLYKWTNTLPLLEDGAPDPDNASPEEQAAFVAASGDVKAFRELVRTSPEAATILRDTQLLRVVREGHANLLAEVLTTLGVPDNSKSLWRMACSRLNTETNVLGALSSNVPLSDADGDADDDADDSATNENIADYAVRHQNVLALRYIMDHNVWPSMTLKEVTETCAECAILLRNTHDRYEDWD